MNCRKSELLAILPQRFHPEFTEERMAELEEIRLRCGKRGWLMTGRGPIQMNQTITQEDLRFCVNAASRYSPWNAATIAQGYLTAPGGHRIGLCGEANAKGISHLTSLCIRVAKDLPGIGDRLPLRESTLILGPPGSGKTTLLRDLIRRLATRGREVVAVADERGEIFPRANGSLCFDPGDQADVLSGKPKAQAVDQLLRAMGPTWIALDEITAQADCQALIRAGWCGVHLLATAHAASVSDLYSREIYRPLAESGLFRQAIVLHPDKTAHPERI